MRPDQTFQLPLLPLEDLAMPADRLLALLHVPRTGGTSLRAHIIRTLGATAVLQKAETRHEAFEAFLRDHPTLYDGRACLVGHMDLDDPLLRHAPKPLVIAGVIRDPVERAISLYDFARSAPEHPLFATLQTLTLWEASQTITSLAANMTDAQARQLFGVCDEIGIRQRLHEGHYVVGRFDRLELFYQRS